MTIGRLTMKTAIESSVLDTEGLLSFNVGIFKAEGDVDV